MMLFLLSFSKKITSVLPDLGTRLLFNRQNSAGLCILQDAFTYLVQFCNPQGSAGRKTGWCFTPTTTTPFCRRGNKTRELGSPYLGWKVTQNPTAFLPRKKNEAASTVTPPVPAQPHPWIVGYKLNESQAKCHVFSCAEVQEDKVRDSLKYFQKFKDIKKRIYKET